MILISIDFMMEIWFWMSNRPIQSTEMNRSNLGRRQAIVSR